MNKKLVFSWGHVVALLTIIIYSYLAFVGLCYYTGGHFTLSFFLVIGIDALLILSFFGAQQLKIWDGSFHKYIILERWLLLVLAPIAVWVAMFPVNHWVGLHDNEKKLVEMFTQAVDTSKIMFSDYETYANKRISQLDNYLNRQQGTSKYRLGESVELQAERQLNRENTMRALRLQLIGQSYEDLHKAAMQWMDETADAPSTLNVFLLGNINEISSVITKWNQQLCGFSAGRLSSEPKQTADYATESLYAVQAASMLKGLRELCRERQPLNTTSLWIAFGLFVLMMVPWWAQNRNTKSTYRIFGREGSTLLELVAGQRGQQKGKKTLNYDEHDYQRHVRKF